jgi:hypothetical protein
MPASITTYEYTDPRTIDGTPFEVAEATFRQAVAVFALAKQALDDGFVMARVAEMERQLQRDEEPDGANFQHTALGISLQDTKTIVDRLSMSIKAAGLAASYNPRKPPKEPPS